MAPTYSKTIYDAVFDAGILSHAGVILKLSNSGMLNVKQIKLHLKRMVSSGHLAKQGASYILSDTSKANLPGGKLTVYTKNCNEARQRREAKAKEQEAGKLREEMRVAHAFQRARMPAKGDRSALTLGKLAGL